MFHTLVIGVPVFTGYEAITYWGFANGYLGFIDLGTSPVVFWCWFGLLLLITPMIHSIVFYLVHRLLHTKSLYKSVHSLHHRNVVVGPWSGLDMHLVEHILYFSTVVVPIFADKFLYSQKYQQNFSVPELRRSAAHFVAGGIIQRRIDNVRGIRFTVDLDFQRGAGSCQLSRHVSERHRLLYVNNRGQTPMALT